MKYDRPIEPREEKLQETLEKAKALYFCQQQSQLMTFGEFLYTQLGYTRKRWWLLQGLLLLLAARVLPVIEFAAYRTRSLGVFGCLFVVFMIPELWRNRESDSIQIEASCFYSLRQVYAARITLFGLADVAMLTIFGFQLETMGFTRMEVLSQFLLPVTVTACICFSFLCGKQNWGESITLAACLTWSGLWWLLLMNEWLYRKVIPSVWALLLGCSLAFLAMTVHRTLSTTNQYWEVNYT